MRAARGGVFAQIDELLAKFEQEKKRFRAAVKERLGSARTLRSLDGLYAVRWKSQRYRAPSVDALLEKLPKRTAVVANE